MKKSGMVLVILICLSLTGCAGLARLLHDAVDSDNPLSGKDTDERIIMCLEETYPGHEFAVVESFDKTENKGLFCDENGIEFSVHSLLYDNIYHFGCEDDYLAELLKKQDYFDALAEITEKYGYIVDIDYASESVWIESSEGNMENPDFKRYASMVREILNAVETPQVIFPEETGFSTGEVNYYTKPCFGNVMCEISYDDAYTAAVFNFEDKDLSVEQLQQRFEDTMDRLKGDTDWIESID